MSTGKMTLEGAVIDSAYVMETTNNNVISYTFPVYRENQGDYFENLVLQKKIGGQDFKSYLYRYKRVGASGYDHNSIEMYDLQDVPQNTAGKISVFQNSFHNGCSLITTYSVDCGEGGHHTNGQYCTTLGVYMPYDSTTTEFTCNGSNNGDGGGAGSGQNSGYGGGNYTVITAPVPNVQKWGICKKGLTPNFLGLSSAQLSFINASAQNALRAEMNTFLVDNGVIDIFDCSSLNDMPLDVKGLGQWIVNYAMTNPQFLKSELWGNFVNTDVQFQLWTKSFLEQNPNVTWFQFENWFLTKSEGQDGIYDEAAELAFAQQTFQQHPLPSFKQYELAFPSKPNAKYPDYYRDAQPNYVVYNDYVGGKLKQLFNQNGGNIKGNPYRNTCAVRQSYTLNKLGIMIPFQHEDLTGDNNWNYIMTASKMGVFLEKTFGAPTYKLEGADANNIAKITKFLEGKTGIYLVINNDPSKETGAGYTGHTDMIKNGYVSGGPNYINDETKQIVRGGIKHFYIWELN